ncbi:acid protease [Hesseltinella vesiculosa]|uniref:Acid protease n=1 Tax=Hesseltinella vesiculosa TaxID=101127 RepID=A0A1X2GSE1_9FUNG|nr:acid protease [Hesseltinella vesiculosa]
MPSAALQRRNAHFNKRTSVPLISDNDVLWYTTIEVGNPPRPFTVDVDTGSADVFIPGNSCVHQCHGHHAFDPHTSSTSKPLDKDFTIEFADGTSAKGKLYQESVRLGGLEAKQQTVGLANFYSEGLGVEKFTPDGLMGLGFDTLSRFNATTFLDSLHAQGVIPQRVFGIHLSLSTQGQGELTIGGYNEARLRSKIVYTPVTDKQFWQVDVQLVSINGQHVARKQSMVVDTGSTMMNLDPTTAKRLYSHIEDSKTDGRHFFYPCDKKFKLTMAIGHTEFEISSETFSLGEMAPGSRFCVGGAVASVEENSAWIVGGVFLSSVYTIFDIEQKRIGFARI